MLNCGRDPVVLQPNESLHSHHALNLNNQVSRSLRNFAGKISPEAKAQSKKQEFLDSDLHLMQD